MSSRRAVVPKRGASADPAANPVPGVPSAPAALDGAGGATPAPAPKPAAGPGVRNNAAILGFIGASGSGKSRSIRAHLERAKPRRLVLWDPMDEYADLAQAQPTLVATFASVARGVPARYVPRGGMDTWAQQFGAFCAGAYQLGRMTVVIEELADVTQPAFAPPAWARCTRSGRHQGLVILAASQRPASIDKSFLGNCSRVRCFRLNWTGDVRVMAGILGTPPEELQRLVPGQWVERDLLTGEIRRGSLP
ncbi:MAG: hypothetical protein ACK52V_16130 [Betaproteobacteria bacterium]